MDNTTIEDARIGQRFLVAGQTYQIVNIEPNSMDDLIVTARSQDTILSVSLTLTIEPRTPFRTLA